MLLICTDAHPPHLRALPFVHHEIVFVVADGRGMMLENALVTCACDPACLVQFQGGIIVSVDSRSTMGPYIGKCIHGTAQHFCPHVQYDKRTSSGRELSPTASPTSMSIILSRKHHAHQNVVIRTSIFQHLRYAPVPFIMECFVFH